jgi:ABC-type transport system involved in multi-copper enzyme maturation permease subunit
VGIDTTILAVGQLFVAGLFAVSNIASLLAIFMASGTIAQEVDQGTLYAIVSKPVALLHSITMLGSVLMPAITAGIAMFILYSVTNVTGLLEQVGAELDIESMVRIGIYGSLVLPADALWKMAAHTVQPPNPLLALGIRTMIGPFMVLSPPSISMGIYAMGYMAAALGAAIWRFSRRDL